MSHSQPLSYSFHLLNDSLEGGGGGCIEEMQKNIGISNLRTQNSSWMRRSYDMFRSKTDSSAPGWDLCDVVTLEGDGGRWV